MPSLVFSVAMAGERIHEKRAADNVVQSWAKMLLVRPPQNVRLNIRGGVKGRIIPADAILGELMAE